MRDLEKRPDAKKRVAGVEAEQDWKMQDSKRAMLCFRGHRETPRSETPRRETARRETARSETGSVVKPFWVEAVGCRYQS